MGAPLMVSYCVADSQSAFSVFFFFSKREGFNNTCVKIRKIRNTELLPFPFVKLAKNKEQPCPHLHSASSQLD